MLSQSSCLLYKLKNKNKNHNEIPFHTYWGGYYPKQTKMQQVLVGKDVEKLEPLCTAGGNGVATVENMVPPKEKHKITIGTQ